MPAFRHRLSETKRIKAAAPRVYEVLADYRRHHPHILPPSFSHLTVVEGGVGAGTTITFDLRVAGMTRHYRSVITEPEPGRVLAETDVAGTGVTSFTVDPRGDESDVTIATDFGTRGGLAGVIERWMAARVLPPIYRDELSRLERYLAG